MIEGVEARRMPNGDICQVVDFDHLASSQASRVAVSTGDYHGTGRRG